MVANNERALAIPVGGNTFLDRLREEYPEKRCNLLVPLTWQPEVEANAIPTITVIQVDPDTQSGDVHAIEGKLTLAKPVLMRMAAGAGIVWNDRECGRIEPSVCQFCKEHKCTQCQYHGRVFAYRAVGGIQYPDGSFHPCVGEYELDLSDKRYVGKVSRSDAPKRAETGAFERATRQALSLKSAYRKMDLEKPFVVVGLRYRLDEQGQQRQSQAALAWQYGSVATGERETSILQPKPPGHRGRLALCPPEEEDDEPVSNEVLWEQERADSEARPADYEMAEGFPGDLEPEDESQEPEDNAPVCGYCKKPIGDFTVGDEHWTASQIVDLNTNKLTGEIPAKLRCGPCLRKLKLDREKKAAGK